MDKYIGYLSEGIADLVNILRPEAIVLGGGVANEGEALFAAFEEGGGRKELSSFVGSSVEDCRRKAGQQRGDLRSIFAGKGEFGVTRPLRNLL